MLIVRRQLSGVGDTFPGVRKMGTSADMPAAPGLRDAIYRVGELLDRDVCWLYQRRWHFPLEDGCTIAISPDSAGRLRLEACRWTRPVATLWTLEDDEARLAAAVRELADTGGVVVGA